MDLMEKEQIDNLYLLKGYSTIRNILGVKKRGAWNDSNEYIKQIIQQNVQLKKRKSNEEIEFEI